nr:MAG TPA: hypothetical protein [Caudoviricetes sp.]
MKLLRPKQTASRRGEILSGKCASPSFRTWRIGAFFTFRRQICRLKVL